MQFYFIRHGQSENNLLWAQTGSVHGRSDDPSLTGTGRQQMEMLAGLMTRPAQPSAIPAEHDGQNVTGFQITHLYCSLMVRAIESATILARALDLSLDAWEDVHEVGGIHWSEEEGGQPVGQAGKNRAYFEEHYPHLGLPPGLGEAGWWNRPFEPRAERPKRAARFLRELLARHGGSQDRVAVVSHGGFYNHLVRAILDLPPQGELWFAINNAAISRIDFAPEGVWMQYLNRVDHLPAELIT
jgi:2,3-bisphosphoglycerate-dependent phosphoglycerate mutase